MRVRAEFLKMPLPQRWSMLRDKAAFAYGRGKDVRVESKMRVRGEFLKIPLPQRWSMLRDKAAFAYGRGKDVAWTNPAARAPTPGIWLLGGLRVRECVLCTYSYAGGRLADWLALLRVRACVRCSCRFTKVKSFSC